MIDFPAALKVLSAGKVKFIIVGGAAGTLHGSARLTQDSDLVYARDGRNIQRLTAALAPHAPYLRGAPQGLPFRLDPATVRRGLNFALTTALGDIVLLGELPGAGSFDQLLLDTVELNLFGTRCLCLGLPRLIAVKRAAGRPEDFEGIAELEVLLDEEIRQSSG